MRKIYTASFSHIGKRANNQDFLISDPEKGIFMVADGVGGYNFGEVASKLASQVAHHFVNDRKIRNAKDAKQLSKAISMTLRKTARKNPQYMGMATTLALVQFYADYGFVFHVGDSRVYCVNLSDGSFWKTKDHSHVQELVDKGMISEKEAEQHPLRHLITRCFQATTVDEFPEPSFSKISTYDPNRIWLLCTDGIFDVYSEKSIIQEIRDHSSDPEKLMQTLETQSQRLSNDNVTVILIMREDKP